MAGLVETVKDTFQIYKKVNVALFGKSSLVVLLIPLLIGLIGTGVDPFYKGIFPVDKVDCMAGSNKFTTDVLAMYCFILYIWGLSVYYRSEDAKKSLAKIFDDFVKSPSSNYAYVPRYERLLNIYLAFFLAVAIYIMWVNLMVDPGKLGMGRPICMPTVNYIVHSYIGMFFMEWVILISFVVAREYWHAKKRAGML